MSISRITTNTPSKPFLKCPNNLAIEIGDSKQLEFQPQLKAICSPVKQNEFNFSLRLTKDVRGSYVTRDQEKIVQTFRDGTVARFYPLGNDFEFDVWQPFRPPNNVVPFTCQSKGLVFYPQRTLKNLSDDGSSWEMNSGMRSRRPVNVNESIAIYYADGYRHNAYKAGKAFHLYRPLAVDARGRSHWCAWILDERSMPTGIRIPLAAEYPVLLDPTLGNTTGGASDVNLEPTKISAFGNVSAFTMSENGTADDINVYRKAGATTDFDVTMGIYNGTSARVSDTAGGLIGTTTISAAFKTQTITGSLTSGTAYRLAFAHDGAGSSQNFSFSYDDGSTSNTLAYVDSTYSSGTLPDPFPSSPALLAFLGSIYINYTASGGGQTTHNTRAFPLGLRKGINRRISG